LHNEERN